MKTNRNVFGLYRCGEKMYRKGSATARDCPACRPHRNRRTPRTPLVFGLEIRGFPERSDRNTPRMAGVLRLRINDRVSILAVT